MKYLVAKWDVEHLVIKHGQHKPPNGAVEVVREWAACEAPEPESVIDAVIDAIDEYDNVTDKAE